ncbi:MAG: nuclear transport factor 2 family protein [Daejeonella sp.]
MKIIRPLTLLLLASATFLSACSVRKENKELASASYVPDSQDLYDTVVKLDSVFFGAYNTCDMEKQSAFYSDSIEFYHDKGGLMTSKKEILDGTRKNICGKVSRELVKGSIEVYPIKGYGAVEMGLHKFHNNTEKESTPSDAGKFVIIWQNKNNEWIIRRVISLH